MPRQARVDAGLLGDYIDYINTAEKLDDLNTIRISMNIDL